MKDKEITDIPPHPTAESSETMDEFASLSESLKKLDQTKLFEDAFNYVKSKKKVKTVNIGLMMDCFLTETTNKQDKFALGWTALAMLRDRKENLLKTIPEEDFQKIYQSIIEKMC